LPTAIDDAVGVRLTSLPMNPEAVFHGDLRLPGKNEERFNSG
jgi:hypothetical protein